MTGTRVPRLHLIGPLEGVVSAAEYLDIATIAAEAGVDAVHVRVPGAQGGDMLSLALELRTRIDSAGGTVLFVNDRVDVALLANAGVHLGERSIPVQQARRLVGPAACIGRSIHDVNGAVQAETDGADYVIAGHVFATDSKRGVPGRGVEWLAGICESVSIPVIAIGGISVERVRDVIDAGAWGVAVGREVLKAEDVRRTAGELSRRIEGK